eukprot:COSAG06_NODE_23138_length_701_cov_2.124585_1_plen_68_part_00
MKKKKDRFTKTGLGQAHISPGKLENKKMAFVYFFVSLRREIDRVKGKVILSGELSYAAQSVRKTAFF